LIKDKQSMSDLMHKIEEDADREVLEKKADFVNKLRELKKINLNLRGELGSYKMKAKACVTIRLKVCSARNGLERCSRF